MRAVANRDIHRVIFETAAQLRNAGDPDKVLRHYLRAAVDFFDADAGYIAALDVGDAAARSVFVQPSQATPDLTMVTALLRGERHQIPGGTLCARITRRRRDWGMLVLERTSSRFPDDAPRALSHIVRALSDTVDRLDRNRLSEVRARIDDMILRELPPKDLYYQILDGLHQLTRYDHSAALWIWSAPGSMELVAEQIAWRKMKSASIGTTVELPVDLQTILQDGSVYGFDWTSEGWTEWTGHGVPALPRLFDVVSDEAERPRESAVLCAPLGRRDGPLGLLKLSARAAGAFGEHEQTVIHGFTSLASVALKRAQTIEDLQARMLKVERQNALAHLARGVAHDINNALGEVIPLVQQIQVDVGAGTVSRELLLEDLRRVEQSLQVTRGIFGRMLRFARGTARPKGRSDIATALAAVCGVLQESLARIGIEVRSNLDDPLPAVRCGQSDLERLLLNLMTNARDALLHGGILTVTAHVVGSHVEVTVSDTGIGMTPQTLAEIEAPFYTTKEHGTGLGLATCRSIAAESGGALVIESHVGAGTRVTARLAHADQAGD